MSATRRVRGSLTLLVAAALVLSASPASGAAGFGDVAADRYYAAPVQWMADQGITVGTAPGCFSPDAPASRGEVAVFLHRMLGQPPGGSEPFDDVHPDDFFAGAVAWMVGAGVTVGTSATTFSPSRDVTRGEVATFLHRVAHEPTAVPGRFTDVAPDAFYAVPVAWMAAAGITTGTTHFTFAPERSVTRAELAAFLYRYAGEPPVALDPGGVCSTDQFAPLATAEARSLELLNQLRASVGRAPLTRAGAMDDFARGWSADMHERDWFRHSGGPYAENIAWTSAGWRTPEAAAQQLHDLWVNSPGHYANMTNPGYTEVGIGFWQGPGGWYATHVFR